MDVGTRQQAIHLGHPPLIPADDLTRAGPSPPARHRDGHLAETRQQLARVMPVAVIPPAPDSFVPVRANHGFQLRLQTRFESDAHRPAQHRPQVLDDDLLRNPPNHPIVLHGSSLAITANRDRLVRVWDPKELPLFLSACPEEALFTQE